MGARRKMKRSLGLWKRPYAGVNHLIVGLGNWYYPLSRESVGLYALERYAQRYSLVWDFIPNICSDALASKTGIALIKPKTYQQKDMGKAVAMATEAMNHHRRRHHPALRRQPALRPGPIPNRSARCAQRGS